MPFIIDARNMGGGSIGSAAGGDTSTGTRNNVTLAAPWDESKEYLKGDLATNNGDLYQAQKSVPAGVQISDEDYWALVVAGDKSKETAQLRKDIGSLAELETEAKENLVAAINEVGSIQPDWNQNDETAKDYIKNRPFYEANEESAIFSGDVTFVKYTDLSPYVATYQSDSIGNVDNDYRIVIKDSNGEIVGDYTYSPVLSEDGDTSFIILGDISEIQTSVPINQSDPNFNNRSFITFKKFSDNNICNITIYEKSLVVKQLDPKYIPVDAFDNKYTLPSMTGTALGGAMADPAQESDTQPVRIGGDGKLYTAPGADGKSAYEYAQDGGYTGTETEFAEKLATDIPNALPNPNALTFTGAVNATYDGSTAVSVEIPSGGSGGTDISLGLTSASVGQIIKVKAIDESGKPTAWEAADMPTGEEDFELIFSDTITEDAKDFVRTVDKDGNPFELKEAVVIVYTVPFETSTNNVGRAVGFLPSSSWGRNLSGGISNCIPAGTSNIAKYDVIHVKVVQGYQCLIDRWESQNATNVRGVMMRNNTAGQVPINFKFGDDVTAIGELSNSQGNMTCLKIVSYVTAMAKGDVVILYGKRV